MGHTIEVHLHYCCGECLMLIATDQKLVIMLKWTLRTKCKAMHQQPTMLSSLW
ncbi:hypothetical protein SynSYN20_01314 [Synechococcus sp. SYN20]|nr:hypothetical protein SynSYN20_01314 [Synechococcus sp. SYN20]